jgi:hypothetical protein
MTRRSLPAAARKDRLCDVSSPSWSQSLRGALWWADLRALNTGGTPSDSLQIHRLRDSSNLTLAATSLYLGTRGHSESECSSLRKSRFT